MIRFILLLHPSRVRGLKFAYELFQRRQGLVAPFTGAGIEIICSMRLAASARRSHPSRVRGLKCKRFNYDPAAFLGRTLHGCVD